MSKTITADEYNTLAVTVDFTELFIRQLAQKAAELQDGLRTLRSSVIERRTQLGNFNSLTATGVAAREAGPTAAALLTAVQQIGTDAEALQALVGDLALPTYPPPEPPGP